MQQDGEFPSNCHHSSSSRMASATSTQAETPPSQGRVFAVWPDDVVGALDQQLSQVPVAGLGDSKLWVAVARLAASGPQGEGPASIPASLEALLVSERQHEGQDREMPNAVDLD